MASQDEGTSSHGLSCVEGATVNVFAIDTIAIASFLCASVVTLLLFAPILFFSSESNPLWYDTTDCVLVKKEPFKTATNAFAARFYVQYEATKGQVLRSSFSRLFFFAQNLEFTKSHSHIHITFTHLHIHTTHTSGALYH